jgi:hypothetical protein
VGWNEHWGDMQMTLRRYVGAFFLLGALSLAPSLATAAEIVTVDNFVRAETDMTLKRYVGQGGFGKIAHIRQPVPIDQQNVIRMNRDTLYSFGVFDLTHPVTITKPDPRGRFQSMSTVSQDHSIRPSEYGVGEFTLTRENIGTRYVFVILRTFVEATSPDDIKAANALQGQIKAVQADAGSFEIPDWDEASLKTVRDAISVLAATKADMSGMFGDKARLNPIDHLLGTAYGWGGSPKEDAMYVNAVPSENDGKTPYTLTVKDVPVDGFWSVTVYNAKGFMEKNDRNAYSFNNVTARRDKDGSITIHFGGDPGNPNYLPVVKGWNYMVRLYQPRKELLDGRWTFPDAKPVR